MGKGGARWDEKHGDRGGLSGALKTANANRAVCRIESHSTDHEFVGISVHGPGRVVGGREGNIKRQVQSYSQ